MAEQEVKPQYERKCENWLKEFQRWVVPTSEAPLSYIFWTGIFALASAVRRRIKVSKKYLGGWEVSPNVFVLLVGPPGLRKTTTADKADHDLLDLIPEITKAPDIITREALLNQLVMSPDASMSINAGEFGEFIEKSKEGMFSFMTNAFDGRRKISALTLKRGPELVEKPCVNMLGGTTPKWIAENMPESVIGGGFASRVIFVYETKPRRRQMYYTGLDQEALAVIRANLLADLKHIATLEGEFELDEDAEMFMENWYKSTAEEGRNASYKLQGFYERRPAYVHKLAMLLHVAYSDDLILYKHDFEMAISVMKGIERNLTKVFEAVGTKNRYLSEVEQIYAYVQANGEVKRSDLLQEFRTLAEPMMLKQLIEGLVDAGLLRAQAKGTEIILTLPAEPITVDLTSSSNGSSVEDVVES